MTGAKGLLEKRSGAYWRKGSHAQFCSKFRQFVEKVQLLEGCPNRFVMRIDLRAYSMGKD